MLLAENMLLIKFPKGINNLSCNILINRKQILTLIIIVGWLLSVVNYL